MRLTRTIYDCGFKELLRVAGGWKEHFEKTNFANLHKI